MDMQVIHLLNANKNRTLKKGNREPLLPLALYHKLFCFLYQK